jgi:hypothetical protein
MLVSPAEAKSFFFPHYADGNGFAMKLVISNHSESHASGWLSVFDSYGRISPLPFDVGETGRVELDLAPHATLTLATRGTSTPIRTGYIEVNADQDALSGLAIFKYADGMEAGTFPISAGREFSLFVERTPSLDTGLAICALSPAAILLKLFDLNGIIGSSAYWPRDKWNPSLNVVIRGNLLEDGGGDGIVPIGCDGALVERNTLRGGATACRRLRRGHLALELRQHHRAVQ